MSVLEVTQLGKAYRRYASEWRRVLSWFGFPFKCIDEHWVLRDINFKIDRGESVGIVGQNGAGKSTLLKIITGTQQATEGAIKVSGRISAILELGMGFNPEFTGRENARHGLGLMGYDHAEIDQAMPYVEEFAEIGNYFDQPVRTYSSGMQMRVAFAVATAFRPDILIVDEALSVGDAYFQHKSFDRIREFQKSGTSLLLVSHDQNAINAICNQAILIDKGRLDRVGTPEEISDLYNAKIAEQEASSIKQIELDNGRIQTVSGSGEAVVESITLLDDKKRPTQHINVGELVTLKVQVRIKQKINHLVFGYVVRDRLGQQVYGTNTVHTNQVINDLVPGECIVYDVSFKARMGQGNYSISTALVDSDTHLGKNYEWRDLALIFDVINKDEMPFVGYLWLNPVIKVKKL